MIQNNNPKKNKILMKYYPGYRTEVKIVAIRPWAIIVGNGMGLDGVVHTRNLTVDQKECDPFLKFKEGDTIEVEVVKYDNVTERFVLSHREILLDNVWETYGKNFKVGQIKKLEIQRISDKGAFVFLEGGIEAHIPLFFLSPKRIRRPKDAVHVGDTVVAEIMKIENREIRLSIRKFLIDWDKKGRINVPQMREGESVILCEKTGLQKFSDYSLDLSPLIDAELSDNISLYILIVDDELSVAKSTQDLLKRYGFKVDICLNGKDGVAKALENDYDLILMDLMMPDIDGFESTRMILKEKPDEKIIIITGEDWIWKLEQINKPKYSGVLIKPFEVDDIINAYKKTLSGENETLHKEMSRHSQLKKFTAELTTTATDHKPLEVTLKQLMSKFREEVNYDSFAILEMDSFTGEIEIISSDGISSSR